MFVSIVMLFCLIAVIMVFHIATSISDFCYNKDYPSVRYGWNGTEHQKSFIRCMDEKGMNPQSLPVLLQGRIIDETIILEIEK